MIFLFSPLFEPCWYRMLQLRRVCSFFAIQIEIFPQEATNAQRLTFPGHGYGNQAL
jgi:hypothetical protein